MLVLTPVSMPLKYESTKYLGLTMAKSLMIRTLECESSTTGKAESQLGIICHCVGRDQQQKKPPATQQ